MFLKSIYVSAHSWGTWRYEPRGTFGCFYHLYRSVDFRVYLWSVPHHWNEKLSQTEEWNSPNSLEVQNRNGKYFKILSLGQFFSEKIWNWTSKRLQTQCFSFCSYLNRHPKMNQICENLRAWSVFSCDFFCILIKKKIRVN